MPDLEQLRLAAFPTATTLVPLTGPPPGVAWVRVLTPRVPAFDALDAGDLALIPATALETLVAGGVDAASVVDALAGAGVAGALLVGRQSGSAATRLSDSAAEAAIALWRIDDDDVTSVERSIIAVLVNERAAMERRAAELEAELGNLALAGADPTALAAVISGALGRAVAIEGPRAEAVAVHAPADPPAASAATAYLANRRSVLLRVPLIGPNEAIGALLILGEPPVTDFERLAVERVVAVLGLTLTADAAVRGGPARRRADALPTDGPPWVAMMARQLVAGASTELDDRVRLRERIARLAPARRLRLRGDAQSLELRVIVAAPEADPLGLDIAALVAARIGRVVAVSRPFERPDDRPLAEQDARATLESVETLPPPLAPGSVARADRLAAFRLLGSLHNLPDGAQNALELLAPILVGRPTGVAERLATLRAAIEHAELSDAASALGVHRNTLAYRIRRLEAASGWRLDDPELRFVLTLAVRLVQDDQERG